MKKTTDFVFRAIEFLLVACIASMTVMVFGNVVLRYGFNSGITISEEASRMVFIWLTFLGAVVAMRGKAHIGVDTLIKRLPLSGKKICAVLSDGLILICCAFFFIGSWKQTAINMTVKAPVTELPMAVIYSAGLVCSTLIGLVVLVSLINVLTGRAHEDDLISVQESQELANLDAEHKKKAT